MIDWEIAGADGQAILGTAHVPDGPTRGVAIIAHGFLGYKDYGMFPALARFLCERGFVAHRFNYSHSGMTRRIETFERPDLFERDTWMKHQEDLDRIVEAIERGDLPGGSLGNGRLLLLGHSRGGVDVLLCAGRRFERGMRPLPGGVVTIAAPSKTCMWDDQTKRRVLDQGFAEVRSNRTGQTLRIDAAWLREQLEHPHAHDVLAHVRRIACPILVIHGEDDPTVPVLCAQEIAEAAGERARLVIIPGADHVLCTPNPFPPDGEPPRALAIALRAIGQWLDGEVR